MMYQSKEQQRQEIIDKLIAMNVCPSCGGASCHNKPLIRNGSVFGEKCCRCDGEELCSGCRAAVQDEKGLRKKSMKALTDTRALRLEMLKRVERIRDEDEARRRHESEEMRQLRPMVHLAELRAMNRELFGGEP
jgi:hypothetical protein